MPSIGRPVGHKGVVGWSYTKHPPLRLHRREHYFQAHRSSIERRLFPGIERVNNLSSDRTAGTIFAYCIVYCTCISIKESSVVGTIGVADPLLSRGTDGFSDERYRRTQQRQLLRGISQASAACSNTYLPGVATHYTHFTCIASTSSKDDRNTTHPTRNYIL